MVVVNREFYSKCQTCQCFYPFHRINKTEATAGKINCLIHVNSAEVHMHIVRYLQAENSGIRTGIEHMFWEGRRKSLKLTDLSPVEVLNTVI